MRQTASQPILLTLPQAASLMKVSDRTIRRWIEAEAIPFLRLPSGGFRIPQSALLASLSSTRDLARELSEQDAQSAGISEDDVRKALDGD
ncbi:MAG: helix-turn-helix domain-containing protein [Solirubrobacterales bacterium]